MARIFRIVNKRQKVIKLLLLSYTILLFAVVVVVQLGVLNTTPVVEAAQTIGPGRLYTLQDGCTGWPYGSNWAVRYSCPGQTTFAGGCNQNGTPGATDAFPTLTCGVVQVDYLCDDSNNPITNCPSDRKTGVHVCFKSRMDTSTCGGDEPPPPSPGDGDEPPVNVVVACNDTCGDYRACPSNLDCRTVSNGDGTTSRRCRLPSNPSSPTCSPGQPQTRQCNQTCNNSNLPCRSGLTCISVGGENRCRLPANPSSATCSPIIVVDNPGIDIQKQAITGASYTVGDPVQFRVIITNTGGTVLSNVQYTDTYDDAFNFVSMTGRRGSGGSVNLVGQSGVTVDEGARTITISNLATILGNLSPNETYVIDFTFIASSVTTASCTTSPVTECNVATVVSGTVSDTASACACVQSQPTDL